MVVDINEVNPFTQSVKEVDGSGGESVEVPIPTEDDSGKVLTAGDDGSVSWESGGSGGGLFVANWDTNSGALDKTAGELITAHESGNHLVVSPSLGEDVEGYVHIDVFQVQHVTYMSGEEEIDLYSFAIYDTNTHSVLIFEASDGSDYPLN